jgi:hypothetical protein
VPASAEARAFPRAVIVERRADGSVAQPAGVAQGWRHALPWIVAAACAGVAIVVLYPGQFAFDSAHQWWQARTGRFSNGSPVAMVAVWALLLDLTGNPAALLCLNLVLYFAGLALCVIVTAERAISRVLLLVAIGILPLGLTQMAHVLTDAHVAAVMVLATGFLATGLATRRRMPLAICGALLVYAGCIRYNALAAVVPYAVVLALGLVPVTKPRWQAPVIIVAVIASSTLAIAALLDRGLVRERVSVWPTIALWDLAAISIDEGTLLLPSFTHGEGLTVDELVRTGAFDPTVNVALFERSRSGMRDGYGYPYSKEEQRALARAWLDAVRDHPAAYVRHRLRTFALMTGRHDAPVHGVAYFRSRIAFADNPPLPSPLAPRAQDAFYGLTANLAPGWSFAALPYLGVALAAGVLGAMRRDLATGRVAIALSASALLYAASYVPLAPAADLRYLTWPIVAAPIALAFALSRARRR